MSKLQRSSVISFYAYTSFYEIFVKIFRFFKKKGRKKECNQNTIYNTNLFYVQFIK